MDLDKAYVYALLAGGKEGLVAANEAGFRPELLAGDGRKAFDVAYDHLQRFGDFPSIDVLQAKTDLVLDPVKEPAGFFAEELVNRSIHVGLSEALKEAVQAMEANDPRKALATIITRAQEIQRSTLSTVGLQSLPAMMREAHEWYERVKAGERGILTPWPSINNATMGFWPEDLVLFVARAGIGKTWTAILVAREAWLQEKKVLFVTTEIAKATLALRFAAAHLKLPYGALRKGELGDFWEERWVNAIDEHKDDTRFMVVGGDFDFRVETLWAYVDAYEPDILVVDGIYLLRSEEKSEKKNERAASVYDELKRGAKRFHIPICATTQFNRTVKKGSKEPDSDAIAQTDASGWNADCAYGLVQSKRMKTDKEMIFHPMKVREGTLDDVPTHWDFEEMNFDEMEGKSGMGLPEPGRPPQPTDGGDDDGGDGGPQTEIPF